MDVIRTLAQEQGGAAELSSERGRWTRLNVRIPLESHAGLTDGGAARSRAAHVDDFVQ
jgi:hypothetical protein